MSFAIKWTLRARERYYEILAYIQDGWGMDKSIEFIDKADAVLDNISEYPKMYQRTGKRNARKAVITKRTSLIYRIKDDDVELITFRDNRKG